MEWRTAVIWSSVFPGQHPAGTALDMLDSLNAPATKESIAVVQPGGEDCNMPLIHSTTISRVHLHLGTKSLGTILWSSGQQWTAVSCLYCGLLLLSA